MRNSSGSPKLLPISLKKIRVEDDESNAELDIDLEGETTDKWSNISSSPISPFKLQNNYSSKTVRSQNESPNVIFNQQRYCPNMKTIRDSKFESLPISLNFSEIENKHWREYKSNVENEKQCRNVSESYVQCRSVQNQSSVGHVHGHCCSHHACCMGGKPSSPVRKKRYDSRSSYLSGSYSRRSSNKRKKSRNYQSLHYERY